MYPIFEFPGIGGGMIIALIATFHILPCHLATGGFWMTYLLERKAYKEDRPALLEFIKKFTLLVLVFCFVTGSLTGVGIWFASTIISPRAISSLIHNYVWGWATEWVFFIIEIVSIYVYYYTFGKISQKAHLRIGLIYAMAAWISMVIITGILAFMMTPGKWVETGGFFDGFFNPTYWPQLFFRTSMMFAIAGAYAAVVASFLKDQETKKTVIKTAGIWGLAGLAGAALFGFWYYAKLPARTMDIIAAFAYAKTMFTISLAVAAITGIYFAVLLLGVTGIAKPLVTIGMTLVIFVGIGGGESVREIGRRPYLIPGYMYSNQVIAHDLEAKGISSEVDRFSETGMLADYYFIPDGWRQITAENYLKAGETITKLQCVICHTMEVDGRSSLPKLVAAMGTTAAEDLYSFLESLGDYPYMPAFAGSDVERRAASAFMATLVGEEVDPRWVVSGDQ
ncbi:MAG: cytochrome ubiquinol oxidase subunit I [Deltaproteobacteria bacterium]|nr:cytochrome ubiquinol oxidase subunit I [Candidatus Anaeroferrophillus wilburensis]MBN2887856.1 cytochrome ubiquinol oxidase subunit I [Deltaproteobacteria bacterium]